MKHYRDLREHLQALEDEHLLQRVTRPINKDTELFPLVRWQFRGGITEDQRRGWLFENVVDSQGKKYSYPFALGVLASSRRIYAIGLGCRDESEILAKWQRALSNPIPPCRSTRDQSTKWYFKAKLCRNEERGSNLFRYQYQRPDLIMDHI